MILKRVIGMLVCVAVTMIVVSNTVSACWMFLSIAEMEQQAGLIVIGELTGEIREVVNKNGTGVTFWAISVEQVFKGECRPLIEVGTGGLVTRSEGENVVIVSTDYRLDSFGPLFLLYLNDHNGDGTYGPLTPRGIVGLERSKGGLILGSYSIASDQHDGEHEEILNFVNSQSQALATEVYDGGSDNGSSVAPVLFGVLMMASVAGLMLNKR